MLDIPRGNLLPKITEWHCRHCSVLLTVESQYPSCRKRGQRCCKQCWNKRFYLAVRKHKYGISRDEFLGLLASQQYKCVICTKTLREDGACVDHDHQTGVIRGILCRTCNSGIGMLGDDPRLLRRAVRYLSGAYMAKKRAEKKEGK